MPSAGSPPPPTCTIALRCFNRPRTLRRCRQSRRAGDPVPAQRRSRRHGARHQLPRAGRAVAQAANMFHALSVGPADVVSLLLPLIPEAFITLLGGRDRRYRQSRQPAVGAAPDRGDIGCGARQVAGRARAAAGTSGRRSRRRDAGEPRRCSARRCGRHRVCSKARMFAVVAALG